MEDSPYQIGRWYKFYKYAPVPVTIGMLERRNVSPYVWYGRVAAIHGDMVVLDHVIFKGGFSLHDLDFDANFHLNEGEALKQCPPDKKVILCADMYEFSGEIPGQPSSP